MIKYNRQFWDKYNQVKKLDYIITNMGVWVIINKEFYFIGNLIKHYNKFIIDDDLSFKRVLDKNEIRVEKLTSNQRQRILIALKNEYIVNTIYEKLFVSKFNLI